MKNKYKEIPIGKAKNLTGQRFNKLTVLYRTENIGSKTAWVCQCDCGNFIKTTAERLNKKHTQSCGCFQKEQTSKSNGSNLIGQTFNLLTVKERAQKPNKNPNDRNIYWLCECQCGNTTITSSRYLKSGHTKSCGCIRPLQRGYDLSNQKINLLTVLELDIQTTLLKKERYWKCRCDCGKEKSISANHLLSKEIISCGCKRISKGELKIKELLDSYNYNYILEKTFPTCKNIKTNNKYRFDFFVNNKYLIEFDGIQHFKKSAGWDRDLQEVIEADNYKNNWCKENNIPLIRIPYYHYDLLNIDDLRLETSNFIVGE